MNYNRVSVSDGEYILKFEDNIANKVTEWIPLVRCKDCRFGEERESPYIEYHEYNCRLMDIVMPSDGYCWYGEREEE